MGVTVRPQYTYGEINQRHSRERERHKEERGDRERQQRELISPINNVECTFEMPYYIPCKIEKDRHSF